MSLECENTSLEHKKWLRQPWADSVLRTINTQPHWPWWSKMVYELSSFCTHSTVSGSKWKSQACAWKGCRRKAGERVTSVLKYHTTSVTAMTLWATQLIFDKSELT